MAHAYLLSLATCVNVLVLHSYTSVTTVSIYMTPVNTPTAQTASALREQRTTPARVRTASADPTARTTSTSARATRAPASETIVLMALMDIPVTVPVDTAVMIVRLGYETAQMTRASITPPVFGHGMGTSASVSGALRVNTVKKISTSVCHSPAGTVPSVWMVLMCISVTVCRVFKVTTVRLTSMNAPLSPVTTTGRVSMRGIATSVNV